MTETSVRGEVIEELPNVTYRVNIPEEGEKICYLAGKMKKMKIGVRIGDKVDVILDPYGGHATNRIIWRI